MTFIMAILSFVGIVGLIDVFFVGGQLGVRAAKLIGRG